MRVEFFSIEDGPRMRRALAIRTAVFVAEQGVPAAEEIDEHDRTDPHAAHALVFQNGIALAAGRFFPRDERTVQIGRMAVRREFRGRGIGRFLLAQLTGEARRRHYRRVTLHAQVHAEEFYRRAGFRAEGEEFLDAGIAHRAMSLEL